MRFSTKTIFIQWLFAIFLFISSLVLCNLFIHTYYQHLEDEKIMQAYRDIEELDLSDLEEKDYALFLSYENENLSFYIADEDMNPVYSTNDNKNAIYHNIVMKLDKFSHNPKISSNNGKIIESVKLRGIITQNNRDYYVAIKDFTMGESSITTVEKFYFIILFLMMIPGSILVYFLSKRLLSPMNRLIQVTEQVTTGNFKEKAEESGAYEELNRLAKSINQISELLQNQEQQMEENRKQLLHQSILEERKEKLRKDLIANISHELKTPLTVISTQVEMLEYAKEKPGDYITSIQEEVSKMSVLVSRILDSSVMENQMENMVQRKLDMKEILQYIVMKYEGLAKKKKLHVETFLSEDCYIYGDREYIEQAVNNYMMNALEHTDIERNIRITLKKQKDSIRVSIYNEGRHIPEDELESIWSSYYQNRTESKYGKNGFSHAGLGLSIVQNVITVHGGICGVENISNGVEFWFTLPCFENRLT